MLGTPKQLLEHRPHQDVLPGNRIEFHTEKRGALPSGELTLFPADLKAHLDWVMG